MITRTTQPCASRQCLEFWRSADRRLADFLQDIKFAIYNSLASHAKRACHPLGDRQEGAETGPTRFGKGIDLRGASRLPKRAEADVVEGCGNLCCAALQSPRSVNSLRQAQCTRWRKIGRTLSCGGMDADRAIEASVDAKGKLVNEKNRSERSITGPRTLGVVTEVLALMGGVVMLAAGVLVCISVGLRWVTSNSVPGDFELVQIAVAVSAFAFLPFCQIRRGNISVDTFTSRLPARVRDNLDALWDFVYALTAVFIAWRLSIGAAETIANRTTTMVSGIPIGWAIAAASATAVLLAIAALTTAWQLVRRSR